MARPLRFEYADTFYHVSVRGSGRGAIFRDDEDRRDFLELVGRLGERFALEVWSYVLMEDQYHLVVRTRQANLSRAMHWLGAAYSMRHNRRHGRSGPLFGDRFKSVIVDEEGYVAKLILHVHRAPLRAGLVDRLADYRWSSYCCLAHGRGCRKWFEGSRVLGLFGRDRARFRRAVREYDEEEARLYDDLRRGLFLGGAEAFRRLMARVRRRRVWPQTRRTAGLPTLRRFVKGRAEAMGLSAEALAELRRPVRAVVRPLRGVLIYLAWVDGRFALKTIGAYFNICESAAASARTRGAAHLAADRRLRKKLARSDDR